MRTFEHFNQSGTNVCPICGTNEDKEVILIPIVGTKDGNNAEACQVHTECLENALWYYPAADDKSVPILAAGCKVSYKKE